MAYQLGALTAPPEVSDLIPSIQIVAHNPLELESEGLWSSLWPVQALGTHMMCKQNTHVHKNKWKFEKKIKIRFIEDGPFDLGIKRVKSQGRDM